MITMVYNDLILHNQNNNVQKNNKENKFVRKVRICIAIPLFDFLFHSKITEIDNN